MQRFRASKAGKELTAYYDEILRIDSVPANEGMRGYSAEAEPDPEDDDDSELPEREGYSPELESLIGDEV